MSSLLSTAVSGLMAFQRSLETTSHNIANVNTDGYSRQRTELATRPERFTGAGFVGTGVNIANITRSYDQFIVNQLHTSKAAFGEVDAYLQLASQVDNILADPDTGMAPAIKDFFNAVNDVADDPSSIPARQAMLSETEILTQRFHTMDGKYSILRRQINQDIEIMVDNINAFSASIAELNIKIASEIGRTSGDRLPNDLLDKRDVLVDKLSELVDVSVLPQQNGSLSVFIGQGQTLVLGGQSTILKAKQVNLDPGELGIYIAIPGGDQEVTNFMSGGQLSGTLRFRDEILDPAQQKLGQLAVNLAVEMNTLHQQGYDLDGNAGGLLFSGLGSIPVTTNPGSAGSINVTYDSTKIGNLDFSDYQLDVSAGLTYTLTRLSDGSSVNLAVSGTNLETIPTGQLPGIAISFAGLAAGDSFLIQPTKSAAQLLNVNIKDPRDIAAATNIEVDPLTGQTVLDGSGNPIIINGPMPGDNRNALLLANLENKLGMLGGTSTFQDAYAQTVSEVGTLTHAANVSSSAQEALLNQAIEQRESQSGVNLDEEAANLIKFQQSYQAAAQLISVTNSLFDSLLGAVRR
jgi:flagellar hook-associated protein 1 FlgK